MVTDCFFQICKKAAMKTHQSLALGFFIAIGLVLSVCGERFEVTSAQQLIKLLNISETNNFDANITLLDDLDFSDTALTLPFGVSSDGSCVSYTGVFEGNGHTIKGLVMNNKDNWRYDSAGLFCALGNATFENLVIDSSCSFTGSSYAGALSVSLTGSLTATNVINKAAVSGGNDGAGGFVGIIQGLNQRTEVMFKYCVNDGTVTGWKNYVGGFVGCMKSNTDLTMTFSDSTNNGNVTGRNHVGGFVGHIQSNTNMKMTISNCTNNGTVTGRDCVGGVVGYLFMNTKMKMTVSNCANDGLITGTDAIGGFIGKIYDNTEIEVNISNCTNNGLITSGSGAGGFVGNVRVGKDSTMSFSDCINNGNITGSVNYVGGLVGYIYGNTNLAITITNCTNNGICTGTGEYVGGFIGDCRGNNGMTINISSIINNGPITGYRYLGGFFGYISDNNDMDMTISNSVNTGEINGAEYVGGLVGSIQNEGNSNSISLSIINSANKGNVSAKNKMACGMFCVNPRYAQSLNGTVLNSINKGSVNATTSAYGITSTITKARNVVSMGEVNASSGSFTFWQSSTDVDLFFGLNGKCVNCTDNTTLFVHNTKTGFYEVVGSGKHVNDLLNTEVEKQNYGMFWTEELELVEPSPSPSSQSGGLSGGNKHGVSLFWISVVVALAAHVAMAQ